MVNPSRHVGCALYEVIHHEPTADRNFFPAGRFFHRLRDRSTYNPFHDSGFDTDPSSDRGSVSNSHPNEDINTSRPMDESADAVPPILQR